MKKALVFLFVGIIFFGCFVQNANAQSTNDAQRIVGTWRDSNNGITFTFNTDGTFTSSENERGNYFLSGTKLVWIYRGDSYAWSINYFISPNGRILVLDLDDDGEMYWFAKQ